MKRRRQYTVWRRLCGVGGCSNPRTGQWAVPIVTIQHAAVMDNIYIMLHSNCATSSAENVSVMHSALGAEVRRLSVSKGNNVPSVSVVDSTACIYDKLHSLYLIADHRYRAA